MHIVAIGWMYVVIMMSITEASIVAGIMTFLFYGVVPVAIILYLSGAKQRGRRREMEEQIKRDAAIAAHARAEEIDESSAEPDSMQTLAKAETGTAKDKAVD